MIYAVQGGNLDINIGDFVELVPNLLPENPPYGFFEVYDTTFGAIILKTFQNDLINLSPIFVTRKFTKTDPTA